jgi:signal peptidase I
VPGIKKLSVALVFTLVLAIVIGIASLIAIRTFLYEPFRAPSMSMAPTIMSGSFVIAEKWGYGHYSAFGVPLIRRPISNKIRRGEIFVFDYPVVPSKTFLKRVIGLPGDKIAYKEKRLSINGKEIDRHAAGELTTGEGATFRVFRKYEETLDDARYFTLVDDYYPSLLVTAVRNFPMREQCTYDETGFVCDVPPDHFFMMGDSRDNSDDSRYWGFVPSNALVGKVSVSLKMPED